MSKDVACPECGCVISGDIFSADQMRKRFFACIRDAHANLRPEHLQRWPNPEALRKSALIAVGHCHTSTYCFADEENAKAWAHDSRQRDRYGVVVLTGDIVTSYTARSMSRRALQKKEFLQVADRVFAWVAETTGIDPGKSEEGRVA